MNSTTEDGLIRRAKDNPSDDTLTDIFGQLMGHKCFKLNLFEKCGFKNRKKFTVSLLQKYMLEKGNYERAAKVISHLQWQDSFDFVRMLMENALIVIKIVFILI